MNKQLIKNWFSNMAKMDSPFEYQGVLYYTSENFYQAMKFESQEKRIEYSKLNCYQSKLQAGREKEIWRSSWNKEEKLRVMELVLRHKFTLETSFGKKLVETGISDIVEWNDWGDTFWGKDVDSKIGENHLGEILMKIRNALILEKMIENCCC